MGVLTSCTGNGGHACDAWPRPCAWAVFGEECDRIWTWNCPLSNLPCRRVFGSSVNISLTRYWNDLEDGSRYPEDFVAALSRDGWLGLLIPEKYGGGSLGVLDAFIIIQEINACGGNAACAHAQMYTMGTILRHRSEEQKQRYLPDITSGRLRLQAFGITEPACGSDTGRLTTTAIRKGDTYVLNGQKIWTSRANHSDLMLMLARTSPVGEVGRRTDGLSVFIVDMREALRGGDHTADQDHDQSRHKRGFLRWRRSAHGQPRRRGGTRFQVHLERAERRANTRGL